MPNVTWLLRFRAEASWGWPSRANQCLSLRVRSPHAFAFVAMFGGILLEFFGPEPAHTRAHGDRLSAQPNAADLNGWRRVATLKLDAAAIKITA
jgi:hypothetical protein